MTGGHGTLVERVDEIRDAFDRSFAEPLRSASARFEHVLAIRVAGQPYAVRLSDIAGVHAGWAVTPVPGPSRELLGIAGFQSALVPVYDLCALLGVTGSPSPRWIVLAAGTDPVAFAFDRLDGHLRVTPDTLAAGPEENPDGRTGRPVIRWADSAWTVVSLPELLEQLRSRRPTEKPPTVSRDTRSDES